MPMEIEAKTADPHRWKMVLQPRQATKSGLKAK